MYCKFRIKYIFLCLIMIFSVILSTEISYAEETPSEYTVVLNPVSGDGSYYTVEYTGNPEVQSNGNIFVYTWGEEATITITVKEGCLIQSSDVDFMEGLVEDDWDCEFGVTWDSATIDRVGNKGHPSGITGTFSDGWTKYTIYISSDAFNKSDGNSAGYNEYCADITTLKFDFAIEGTPIENSDSPSISGGDEVPSEHISGHNTVAQNIPDNSEITRWQKVIEKIKEFEKIIEIITNFMYGFGILTAVLSIMVTLFEYSIASTHPLRRRESLENLASGAICIALFGSIKLFVTLIIQIAM